jgi:hypothetical protein
MPDQRNADKVGLHVYVPRELREAAQATSQAKGETVTDVVARALRSYVRRNQ